MSSLTSWIGILRGWTSSSIERLLGRSVTIDDLWLLSRVTESETRLHELIEWRIQRASLIAKGTVGTAASFVVTLLVAQFKAELQVSSALVACAVAGAVLVGALGIYIQHRVVVLETEYSWLLYVLRLLNP
jgi:hypothetical protein